MVGVDEEQALAVLQKLANNIRLALAKFMCRDEATQ